MKKKTIRKKGAGVTQKFKEADQYVKSIFLASFLLIVFIAGTGISQMLGRSYAAEQPMASLPDTLTSKQEQDGGLTATVPSSWVEGIPAESLNGKRNTYQFAKRFYGISDGVEYELYCLERWLGQPVDVTYTKTDSASALSELNIDYKKMAYLLSQLYPNNDNFLSQLNGDPNAKYIKKFVSQLAIWYFQDLNANYQDNQDICGRPETEQNGCSNNSDPDERTEFYWKNSLLAAEKEALKKSPYFQEVNQIVTDALNYSEDTNYGITVNQSTMNYTLVEDDKYLESTLIEVVSKGSNFKGYTLQSDQSDVTFYNEQGAEIKKGTTVQPGQKFRFRVPVSTVRENKNLNLSIHINGTFESKEAYMYRPESMNSQRALIGTMQLTPIPASIELHINDPMGSARISKVDATTGKEVPGATLVLTDSNGKEVARWVSTNEPHYIDPIKAGTYTLTETIAPEGYAMSTSSVQFTVTAGEVVEVKMQNVPEIDVPDTYATIPTYVYIVGAIAFLIGAGLIYISLKPRHEQ